MPLVGVNTRKAKSSDVKALSESAMRHNNAVIEYCRTSCCVLFGCLAGILGLTGIAGFAFYLCCLLVLWCSILTKTGFKWDKYFISKFHLFTNGLIGGLFTYILFWTFVYGMIHVY